MQRYTTHVSRVMAFCLLALLLIPFSALAAKPSLKAPTKAVVGESFMVTVQQAPPDLTWNYDTGKLRLIGQSPGEAVFEPVAEGRARLSASSAQTGWFSGDKTVQISPATGSKPPGKPGSKPEGEGGASSMDKGKAQAIQQLLEKYKGELQKAGLEDRFTRQGSGAETSKVRKWQA